jgi:putative pyoverdin transport system ATP-binding/permease protein
VLKNNKKEILSKFTNYLKMLGGNSVKDNTTLGVYALISAVANSVIIMILNLAADNSREHDISLKLLALFAISMVVFYIAKRFILRQATKMTEKSIHKIRIDVVDSIRKAELKTLEEIGKSTIFTRITQDTNFISQTSAVIVNAGQSAILVFFTLFYVLYLSIPAFFITIFALGCASLIFLTRQQQINQEINEATQKETELFDSLSHILDGFKELKINHKKNNYIMNHFKQIAKDGRDLKTTTGLRFAVGYMFSETAFYMLIGAIVFIIPQYTAIDVSTLTKLTTAILFIIGPLENIVSTIPIFFKANIAIRNINKLKAQIKEKVESNFKKPSVKAYKDFKSLKLIDLKFDYKDKDMESSFTVGPINLEIKRNTIYLIRGGNGSGKSSLLKLLSGLYKSESGRIEINNERVQEKDYPSFRELFAIIFTDFHLFDRLYGLKDIDDQNVKNLIKKFGLVNKTDFADGKFTNIDLSTGQKKRLGLIVSILEDKMIYIFDEVAADQDPEFRQYFYTKFLQELKNNGKTVILVSHDDKYFDTADKIIEMDNGLIKSTKI